MRILAIAHLLGFDELSRERARKDLALAAGVETAKIIGNGAVVTRGMLEHLDSEVVAGLFGKLAATLQLPDDPLVVSGVNHHRDEGVILGRRAQHRRTANVDVFHCGSQVAAGLRHGLLKGVEVHHQKVYGIYFLGAHRFRVNVAASEQAAVDLRMQRLYPAVHDFGKTGMLGYLHNGNTALGQQAGGAARG